jgi:hydrogenase-4 component F
LVILLTASVALLCAAYAIGYLREDERSGALTGEGEGAPITKLRKYYTLTPLFAAAMLLVAMANNLGVMWVAVEATTLASVFLVTFYGKPTSIEAAWKSSEASGCRWRCSARFSFITPATTSRDRKVWLV